MPLITLRDMEEIDLYVEHVHAGIWKLHLELGSRLYGVHHVPSIYNPILKANRKLWISLAKSTPGDLRGIYGLHFKSLDETVLDIPKVWKKAYNAHKWLWRDKSRLSVVFRHFLDMSDEEGVREVMGGFLLWILATFLTVWGPGGTLNLLGSQKSLKLHNKAMRNMRDLEKIIKKFMALDTGSPNSGWNRVIRSVNPKKFRARILPFLNATEVRFRLVPIDWQFDE